MFTWIRKAFLTGIIVIAPLAVTFLLLRWFVTVLDSFFKPFIPTQFHPSTYLPFDLPGTGLVLAFVIITLIGGFAANYFGGWFVKIGDKLIRRMPVAGTVYTALKQILTATLSQDGSTFSQVALIEYPRKGIYAIVFVTKDAEDKINKAAKADLVSVFLPTTPNPTSGFLLLVPRKDLTILDMSVEEGARLVISAGISDEDNGELASA